MKNELTEIELQKIIHQVLEEHTDIMYIPDIAPYILEKLGNAGFRCVGDNMVAIRKEEYEELKRRPSTKEWVETCRGRIEQTRKETAKNMLKEITKPVNTLTRLGYTQYVLYQNDIDKLAKEYGVEVER